MYAYTRDGCLLSAAVLAGGPVLDELRGVAVLPCRGLLTAGDLSYNTATAGHLCSRSRAASSTHGYSRPVRFDALVFYVPHVRRTAVLTAAVPCTPEAQGRSPGRTCRTCCTCRAARAARAAYPGTATGLHDEPEA